MQFIIVIYKVLYAIIILNYLENEVEKKNLKKLWMKLK